MGIEGIFTLMKKQFLASMILGLSFASHAGSEASAGMGKGLYTQAGANSCLYCHGADGAGGNVAAAAKLSQPSTWKIYAILGGKAEAAKDKAAFLKKMKEATLHLIVKGAIVHNASFKQPWFDLKKAKAPYDAQMLGLSGAPSKKWLKKFAEKGITPEVAAESAYLYVQSLDQEKFF